MSHPTSPKYIIIAGGLTGGPVTPLLGVIDFWQTKDARITPVIVDVAPSFGQTIAAKRNIQFYKLTTGKLRRYKTWKNILVPFLLITGLIQALFLLHKIKPKLVLGAGGFVQLPVMYAAWLLRIPRAIHQQDVLVTMSNRLCTPIANLITTTFEFSIRDFPQETGLGPKYIKGTKVYWTGNPVMYHNHPKIQLSKLPAEITLNNKLPVLLVVGGGGGAQSLNDIIINALPQLTKVVQVIHQTGLRKLTQKKLDNYFPFEISSNMSALYSTADLVIARAGINTLTELAEFGKPSIIVPMPQTHQELNAELFFKAKAALILDQDNLNSDTLIKAVRKIMFDADLQKSYITNMRTLFPKQAANKIVALLEDILSKQHDPKN